MIARTIEVLGSIAVALWVVWVLANSLPEYHPSQTATAFYTPPKE